MSAAKKGKGKEKEKAPAASPAPAAAAAPAATAVVPANSANPSEETKLAQRDLLEAMYGLNMRQSREAGKKEHKFWNTQPVPQSDETPSDHGPIEVKTVADVRAEPYALPDQFEWSDCDTGEDKTIDEVYNLLNQNYVEDDDNMFRFDYSRGFLQWALRPPGFLPQLHLGVRVKGTGKLVGFITGIPAHIRAYDKVNPMVEINFLCVHKKLRAKRLAPVLIKEITRRVNLTNVWQAVYTAGVVLPKPVGRTRYHHRSLNPKKLIDIGFSRLARNMTLARTIKLYKLPDAPQIPGIRALTVADVPAAYQLLHNYLKNFSLVQEFDEAEFAHWLLPRPGVVSCYVVEDPASKKLTDMVSFYCLPSTIIGNPNYSTLKAAYSFYNVSTKTPWVTLMTDALILAKQEDFDVFNALDLMENKNFFEPLKFGVGDGCLQYYLYNWRCPEMPAEKVGLVLL